MKRYFYFSLPFVILSAITMIALGMVFVCCDKVELHLWLNGTHTPAGDFFFRYYTLVGEWIPYFIVAALLFYKAGWASFLLADVAISGGISQGLKYWANTDRPLTYFANHVPDIQLQLVDGVSMSEFYSFPSGHTTTFFALFMTLAIMSCDWYHHQQPSRNMLSAICTLLSVVFFLLAIAGAYSRIYLNQHFIEDVWGGMIIGVITTIGLLFIVPHIDQTKFWSWNLKSLYT